MGNEPLSNEEYLYLLSLGSMNTDLANALQMQMAMSKNLRVTNGPQMREAGRVAVAPHPLEVAGDLARNYVAGQMDKRAYGAQQNINQNRQLQNQMILRGILNNTRMPTTDPTQAGMSPPPNPSAIPPSYSPGYNPFLDGGQ